MKGCCRAACPSAVFGLAVLLLAFSFFLPVSAEARPYALGISPEGTSWYEGLSEVFRVMAHHMSPSVEVVETGGTLDNAQRLTRRELDFGFVEMLVAHEWYRGLDRFDGRSDPEARLAFVTGSTALQWGVRADSGIHDVNGLQGRPFNPSTVGGGGERLTALVFDVLGVEPDFRRMHIAEAAKAVLEGELVGFSYNGPPPISLFAEVHAVQPLRLLSLSDEQLEAVVQALPFLSPRVIPAGTYAGMPAAQTVGLMSAIVTTSRVPEDVVYEVTRAYWENHDAAAAVFPAVGEVNPEDVLKSSTIPLHAGAVRYYREIGLDIPEHLLPPEAR